MKRLFLLISILTFTALRKIGAQIEPPCSSQIYCTGSFLKTVQMETLYPDSKSFVDMSIRNGSSPESVLEAFTSIEDITFEKIQDFVKAYFENGNEFEPWVPEDWTSNPKMLEEITDSKFSKWARELNNFWKELGRKIKQEVKDDPERFSLIYVSNGIIVPGGRFREFYYWDSYWIQIGLLHSEMNVTVRGMIDNFLEMIEQDDYGFVPNGGRIYYRRSQPPLLIPMVKNYVDHINVTVPTAVQDYLTRVLPTLEKEFLFWVNHRMVSVMDSHNKIHQLAIYNSTKNEPRPESFREDYNLANALPEPNKTQLYTDLHSGAESGWDFSSRWWSVPNGETGELVYTRTTNVIPVDLNAFLYLNARLLSEFYEKVGESEKAEKFQEWAENFQNAIMSVLWDEEIGSWFDYDRQAGTLRKKFYMSNIVPLWAGVNDTVVERIVTYLHSSGALKYPGGVPTSLQQTGEQWDYPNGWAPLEHLFVDALAKSNNVEAQNIAFDIANKWTLANYKYYEKKGGMLEKYDVTSSGTAGGGGEYEVVVGFGWTNGVILDFLTRYGDKLRAPSEIGNGAPKISSLNTAVIVVGSISIIVGGCWW